MKRCRYVLISKKSRTVNIFRSSFYYDKTLKTVMQKYFFFINQKMCPLRTGLYSTIYEYVAECGRLEDT